LFKKEKFSLTGLPMGMYHPEGIEFWERINLMKAGIVYADVVNTVSEKYSQEIQTAEYGYGLDGILRKRRENLYGVLNGVDYQDWDPSRPLIAVPYDHDLGKKEYEETSSGSHLPLLKNFPLSGDL
jgi:starch synthase